MNTTNETATASRLSPSPAPAAAPARAATWDIDASHANAGFKVRHLMVSHVRGHLGPVTGTVFIDEQDLYPLARRRQHRRRAASTRASPSATSTCAAPTSSTSPTTRP